MNKSKFVSGLVLGAALGVAGGFALQKNKGRIKAKLWYLKTRADIERQVRGLKKFTQKAYDEIVEQALKEYGAKAGISAAKLALIETELKSRWEDAKDRFEEAMKEEAEETDDEDDE